MSYKNQQLNVNNVTSHTHTIFDLIATEAGQQKIVDAINNINISAEIGDITVESSDSITHSKLDTLNTTVSNKHLNSSTDSVNIGNFPTSFEVSNLSDVPLITGFATEETLSDIKTKTDNLTFNNNAGVLELNTFDSQVYTAIGNVVSAVNDKHLDSTTDSVTVSGTVSIDTTGLALETTLQSIDGKINNDSILTDAIQVSIKNASLVVDTINNSINEASYDLIINGATLWADSTPVGNPFFADPNGREGWYYDNQSNVLNKSNIYWYANPTSGNLQENDMAFSQLSGMYCVVTNDYVENGALTIPIMVIYSQPTGTNDIIPSFAHSSWSYALTNTNVAKLRKGETVMLYTGATRPERFPNLPSYPLQLAATNGDALSSEIIGYMSVNTQGSTSKIGYLLQYCGYLNSAIGFNREYSFKNSIERLGGENLSSLTFEDGKLIIYSAPIVNAIQNKHLEFGYDKVDASGSSVSISNFPATQPVSGTIAFSNTSIEVSGTVAFSNTSIQVSSMPNLNANTDSVTIVPNGDSLPISGSVSVSNFPATQPISGSVSVSNFPATQPVSGSVSVSNFPATQPVSIASTVPVSGTFFQETQPVSGSVSVSNFPATQPVSIASTVPVSGTFFQETQPISGSISNSFTLDTTTQSSNTKLDTIHTDLDGLTFDGSSNLNVNIAAGSISVSSVNIKDSAGNNLNSTSNALNSYITNTSVDTHCYASSNGTNWHHLSSDANGQLNIHSKTQDGAGTDITSTLNGAKQSLDVNVSNTVPVSGTFFQTTQPVSIASTVAVSGTFFQTVQPVSLKDGSDNSLTSTDTTATQRSLDTASCLYTTNTSTRSALTSTAISSIRALDVNVANSSVPVTFSNTTIGISGTASVSDTTSQGYLNTINSAIGDNSTIFQTGNLIDNGSLSATSFSTERTFTRGTYKRNTLIFYRDINISNTGSISLYSSTTSGTPSSVLLGTFYPISNGTFRQFTGTFNLLPFASLFIRNDSDTTVTSVYVSYVNG
jgi:hypothetical protein